MKTLFRILGTAAAVAVTGAAIVVLDKILNQKDPLHVEEVEFPEEAEKDAEEAEKTADAYAEAEAKEEAKAADTAAEEAAPEAPAENAPQTQPETAAQRPAYDPPARRAHAAQQPRRQQKERGREKVDQQKNIEIDHGPDKPRPLLGDYSRRRTKNLQETGEVNFG